MALNWLEDIVAHLYRLKGYMVVEDEDLLMPKTAGRRVGGHSDIDIMAIKDNELIHIECQTWWGSSTKDEKGDLERLKERFEIAQQSIPQKYAFLRDKDLRIRNMFVTTDNTKAKTEQGPWGRLKQFCNKHEIELVEIELVVRELIKELKTHYPRPEKVGKEEGIARALIYLIHHDFLK